MSVSPRNDVLPSHVHHLVAYVLPLPASPGGGAWPIVAPLIDVPRVRGVPPFPPRAPRMYTSRQDSHKVSAEKMPSSARHEALGRDLGVAATQGRLDRVERLLAAGAAKEIPTPVMGMMMTPLNAAAYTNNVSPEIPT